MYFDIVAHSPSRILPLITSERKILSQERSRFSFFTCPDTRATKIKASILKQKKQTNNETRKAVLRQPIADALGRPHFRKSLKRDLEKL